MYYTIENAYKIDVILYIKTKMGMKIIPYALLTILCFLIRNENSVVAQELRSINHDGIERTFIHYTPSGYDPDSSYALLFALHGFTQDANTIMDYSEFNSLAEEHGFIVVYPNGINRAWNTQSGFPGGSTADDVGFISQLIDLLSAEQNINIGRIYACGLSAGGFMSYILACELQDQIRAIASVAGTYSPAALNTCQPDRPFPILHIHGTADLIVPEGGNIVSVSVEETLLFWRNQNGCAQNPIVTLWPDEAGDGTQIEQIEYIDCHPQSAVQYLRVINGGHTWPGATIGSGLGTTTQNLDASRAIWDFFSEFESSGTTQRPMAYKTKLRVFPNPAQDQIHILLPREQRFSNLEIFTSYGREIFHRKLYDTRLPINISHWPSGIYWLKVDSFPPISWIKI